MAFALADGRIDDEAFLDDVDQAFDDRTETVLNRLDTHNWDLLIGVIDATDQVQHLMWRHIDSGHPAYDAALAPRFGTAIEHVYKRADDFVAAVRARLPADTALVVLSAYGFHTYRASVHLNAFLADRGYLAATSPPAAPRTWHDFFTTDSLGSSVDWPRTRAYALGFGQIYVNLRGREGQGVVAPGAERTALIEQLRTELLALRDPTTGRPVVQQVDVLPEGAADAPDLQVGFAPGYRASWPTVFGDAPTRVVVPNLSRWSGDHASMAAAGVPGVWLSSVKLPQDAGGVLDVAPSVLAYFGVPAAAGSSARRLF
jgi:predicted AlkP superfamily phosphohydrolase/phosphomutase